MDALRVVCGIIMRDGLVFAARRAPPHSLAGLWEFPGGKVEDGEDEPSALRRELQEELGLSVLVGSPLTPVLHRYPSKQIELIPFLCTIVFGEEPTLTEHDAGRWITVDELGVLSWAPADIPIVQELQRRTLLHP
jgi:8-oxo-dGTP diphosphatase